MYCRRTIDRDDDWISFYYQATTQSPTFSVSVLATRAYTSNLRDDVSGTFVSRGVHKRKIQWRGGKETRLLLFCVMQLSDICIVKVQKEVKISTLIIFVALIWQGLIIIEAAYSPIEKDDRVNDLTQDVTIPVQALVRNSQLHIPGDQSKVCCTQYVQSAELSRNFPSWR